MYFIIRGVIVAVLAILAATFASTKAAAFTAEQAMSQNLQLCLTGLAGVATASAVAGVGLLLLYLSTNRE